MEGQVYLCSWEKVGRQFRLWVKNNPKLTVTGASFAAAEELLWEKILEAYGDGENVHEFVPPPPQAPDLVKLLDIPIVKVSGNTHSAIAGDKAALFTKGVCSLCGKFLGKRSSAPLTLEGIASGYDGGFVWQKPFSFFSEDFLKLLTPKERAQFDWRRVELQRKSRKKFFELLPKTFVPFVAVKGLKFDIVVCDRCKTVRGISSFNKGTPIYQYLCAADLPKPLPSCFAAGWPHDFGLCFRRDRWLELAGRAGTNGLVSNQVGVVDEFLCERKAQTKKLSVETREFAAKERAKKRQLQQKMSPVLKRFDALLQRAKAGNTKAQFDVAQTYTYGLQEDVMEVVFKQDDKKASFWFEQAATRGHAESMGYIANNYLFGAGVKQDWDKGVFWLEQLSMKKREEACGEIMRIILSGHALVRELKAHAGFVALANRIGGKVAQKWTGGRK